MTNSWIHRALNRQAKHTRNRGSRKRARRHLLLQGLETRQLLAGDMMMPPEVGSANVAIASMDSAMNLSSTPMATNHVGHHMANPAAMALISSDQATNTVVASGNWSDPSVWKNGTLPVEGARIIIPQGMTLTVDSVIPTEFKTIGIHGTLDFATDVNTELRVETMVSAPGGKLTIGTLAQPIDANVQAKVVFADDGAIDRTVDPELLSRGALLQGQTTIYGAAKTGWTTLAQQPRAGATVLELAQAPVGWRAGDEIVVAGTDPNDPSSDEVVRIASVDGATVTLTSPLQKDHVAPEAGLDVHVSNNTRNVVFTSENSEISRRGHVMFMHTLDVDVNYASFEQLGRTDKSIPLNDSQWIDLDENRQQDLGGTNVRGRYSVHFHRGGIDPNSQPAKVHGSVVVDDPGWAYVNHSANVDFSENVAYNTVGAAYNTEAGDEIGSFINNIAIRTVNSTDPLNQPIDAGTRDPDARELLQDYGWQGDGFWFHGPHVRTEGNVVSGASGHAYIWWPEGLLEKGLGENAADASNIPNGDLIGPAGTKVKIYDVPVGTFDNNQAYSATKGIQIFYLHTNFFGGGEEPTGEDAALFNYRSQLNSTFSNSTLWGISQTAVETPYASRLTFDGLKLVGHGAANSIGMDLGHFHNQTRFDLKNLDVRGFDTGVVLPTGGNVTVDGGTFGNVSEFVIKNPEIGRRSLAINGVTFADLPNSLSGQEGNRMQIRMQPDFTPFGANDADKDPLFFLQPDQIILNYGPYQNAQLYFNEQAANFIPVSADNPVGGSGVAVPAQYVGKTNGELASQFNLAFGGALLPDDAAAVDGITGGLVGSVSEPLSVPPEIDSPGDDEELDDGEEQPVDDEEMDPIDEEPGDEEPGDEEESDGEEQEEDGEEADDGDESDEEDDVEDGEESDEEDDEAEDGEETDEEEDEADDGEEADEDEAEENEDGTENGDETDGEDDEGDESDDVEDDEASDAGEDELGDEEGFDEGEESDEDLDESESGDEIDLDEGADDGDEADEGDELEDDEDGEEVDEEDDEADGSDETGEEDEDEESDEDDLDETDLHNDDSPTDVNNDGSTTPFDALMVINFLSIHGPGFLQTLSLALQHYVDVNNDRSVSAFDALQIINALSHESRNSAPAQAVDAVFGAGDDRDDEEDDDLLAILSESHVV